MPRTVGRHRRVIAQGCIPPGSMPDADETLVSPETACILTTSGGQTEIAITVYLSDRQPTAQISLMTTIACPVD